MSLILPYDYLPFAGSVRRGEPEPSPGALRGWLEYTVTTRSLSCFGASKEGAEIHPFLTPEGKLAIPSTEMKSIARRAYEAQTCSCVSSYEENQTFRWKNTDNQASPALLEWSGKEWQLVKAEVTHLISGPNDMHYDKDGTTFVFSHAPHVRFLESGNKRFGPTDSLIGNGGGYLHFSIQAIGQQETKLHAWVFHPVEEEGTRVTVIPTDATRLEDAVVRYVGEIENKINNEKHNPWLSKWRNNIHDQQADWIPRPYCDALESKEVGIRIPIYYQFRRGHIYLYHARLMKLLGTTTVADMLGDLTACRSKQEMCPACHLFGLAGEYGHADDAWGARLAFSIAESNKTVREGSHSQTITWHNPSSPHWPLEFTTRKTTPSEANTISPDAPISLLGRKYYLPFAVDSTTASIGVLENLQGEIVHQNQDVQFRPIRQGVAFTGKVYFENITEQQICDLVKVFETEGETVHRAGLAKPYGFGSLKIVVTKVTTITTDAETLERSHSEIAVPRVAGIGSNLDPEARTRWMAAMTFPFVAPDGDTIAYANREWHQNNKMSRNAPMRWMGDTLRNNP